MIPYEALPTLNAFLNSTSAVLLLFGYWFIRHKRIADHKICMLSALVSSTLFLTSYIVYHVHIGSKHFPVHNWVRTAYLCLLTSHTLLALTVVPLVLVTLNFALRGKFDKHMRIAKWTFPIWLYVSVTGVVVYLMLYHLY